jgi:hypothetical protein
MMSVRANIDIYPYYLLSPEAFQDFFCCSLFRHVSLFVEGYPLNTRTTIQNAWNHFL